MHLIFGVINGYPDGTFGPNNTVSYAEATAMILRALDYENEVKKSSEVWPNNYMSQAKKLSLFSNAGSLIADDGAKRGNVAIMLWNMLRTGVCTPVGQNSNGIVYGQGEKLLNIKMTKFIYLEDALINNIDFDDDLEDAEIEIKTPKKITIKMDAMNAAKMYGQKYNILYNNSTKKVEQMEKSSDNTIKEGEIEKLTSSKIYLDTGSSKGYELPDDDNILLYGIDDLEDATSATLIFEGSTLKYVVAFPPENVYLALVTDNDVTVSKKDGIKVVNYKTSSAKSYALADEDDIPDEDDIILYYLNSDNEIVIISKTCLDDSELVENASKTKITLEDAGKITLGSTDTYYVAKVTSSSLKSMSISDIEPDEDSADVLEFGGIKYIVVYVGGVEAAEKENAADLKNYQSSLTSYITKANKISEKSYTQSTYAALIKALDAAQTVKDSSSQYKNLSKVKTAYNNLKSAYDKLSKATSSTEKETVATKYELRTLVNSSTITTIVKNKSTYTTASYSTFNTALSSAKTILAKTNATKANIQSAIDKLESAIEGLVKVVEDKERTEAISNLNKALESAKKVGSASEYTKDSYDNFTVYLNEAKAIKTSTAELADIIKATENLERAIRLLEKGVSQAINVLNDLLLQSKDYIDSEDDYMPETFVVLKNAVTNAEKVKDNSASTSSAIEKAAEDLEKAIDGLEKVDTVLTSVVNKAKKYRIESVTDLINEPQSTRKEKLEKISALEEAMEREDSEVKIVTKSLNAKIAEAKSIASKEEWEASGLYTGTYEDMQSALKKAEEELKKDMVTSEELRTAYTNLSDALK